MGRFAPNILDLFWAEQIYLGLIWLKNKFPFCDVWAYTKILIFLMHLCLYYFELIAHLYISFSISVTSNRPVPVGAPQVLYLLYQNGDPVSVNWHLQKEVCLKRVESQECWQFCTVTQLWLALVNDNDVYIISPDPQALIYGCLYNPFSELSDKLQFYMGICMGLKKGPGRSVCGGKNSLWKKRRSGACPTGIIFVFKWV